MEDIKIGKAGKSLFTGVKENPIRINLTSDLLRLSFQYFYTLTSIL